MGNENSTTNRTGKVQEGFIRLSLHFNELNDLGFHCDILKDFEKTSLETCIALHSNHEILVTAIDQNKPEQDAIKVMRKSIARNNSDINEKAVSGAKGPELLMLRESVNKTQEQIDAKIDELNEKIFLVDLNKISKSDFPSKREDFGKKIIYPGTNMQREVAYINSFMALLNKIII